MALAFANAQQRQGVPLDRATVQKLLDENAQLIQTITDYQNCGRLTDATQFQDKLQRNLVYLASIADANLLAELEAPFESASAAAANDLKQQQLVIGSQPNMMQQQTSVRMPLSAHNPPVPAPSGHLLPSGQPSLTHQQYQLPPPANSQYLPSHSQAYPSGYVQQQYYQQQQPYPQYVSSAPSISYEYSTAPRQSVSYNAAPPQQNFYQQQTGPANAVYGSQSGAQPQTFHQSNNC